MTELLPCPFCGSEVELIRKLGSVTIKCPHCTRNALITWFVDTEKAWNTRPIETALREQLEQERMPEDVRRTCVRVLREIRYGHPNKLEHEKALSWLNGKAVK